LANNDNRTPEQIKEALGLLEDEKDIRAELNKLTETQLEKLREISGLENELLGLVQKTLLSKRNSIENLQEEIEQLQKVATLDKDSYARQQAKNLLKEAESELQAKLIRQYEKEIKQGNTINAQKLKELKTQRNQKELFEALGNLPGMGMISKLRKGGIKSVGLAATGALLKWGQAMWKMSMDLHNMEAAFMKATGASKDFAGSVTNVYAETRRYGMTAEDASAATQALYTGFTDFTFASKQQRESLMKTTAVLGRMGIGHQDLAAGIQISTKALGMSAEAAGQEMLDMAKFAENLGVAPAEMAKQFAGAGDMMAKMGDQGVGAFKDLQIAAKVSGMQMEKILQLTNKFDTFEGAAEMAGKLNAAMGGNFVNAMDMMMATNPAERFGMIRDSLEQAGLSFDDMSYYQKKFYADSLGLSDVSELALIMSGNMDLVSGSVEQSSQDIEDAAKRMQTMASFQDKLNGLMAGMVPIITPIVDSLADLVTWITESEDRMETARAVIVGLVIAFAALSLPITGTSAAIMGLIAGVSALSFGLFKKKSSPTFLEGIKEIGVAFEGIGTAMDALPDFMKGGAGLTASMTNNTVAKVGAAGPGPTPYEKEASRRQATETVRQPISIELKGEKLADFVVEVVGEKVYEINYA